MRSQGLHTALRRDLLSAGPRVECPALVDHDLHPDLDPARCSQVDPAVKQYPDETSVQHVLAGISEAEPFSDVGPAITALHEAGIKARFVTPKL